jgi:peptide/nickel transport system substrate-binding protein
LERLIVKLLSHALFLLVAGAIAVAPAAGVPEQTPKRGGTLVSGTTEVLEPACLRVFADGCGQGGTGFSFDMSHVLAGAFEVTADATFRGNLVSGARIVAREPFTLVYHIRPEARWSDGVPVSAQDFVFTYQVLRRHGRAAYESERLRSVRKIDRKTVRVVLREPYVDWRYLFGIVLPKHALAGEDLATVWRDRIDNPKTGKAIGSGPFLVGPWARGKQLTFVRNRRYWGPHVAHLDRLVFRFLPPEDVADALRTGEIDLIFPNVAVLEAQARELRRQREPGIRVVTAPGNGYEHLWIRIGEGGHPLLRRSPLVRQALAYGIDRVAMARSIGELNFERASTSVPQDSLVFLKRSPYYRQNWSRYRLRAARVRELLGRAGCRRGLDGIYSCGGDRLSFRFLTAGGIERRELTVRLAQEQLRRVGIEVTLEYARPAALVGIIQRGEFEVLSFGWFLGASTSGPGIALACQREENVTGYCDRLLTRDLLRATRTFDLDRRVELLNRIDARLAKAVPHLPLYEITGLDAFSVTVRGIAPGAAGSLIWNVEDWWLDR